MSISTVETPAEIKDKHAYLCFFFNEDRSVTVEIKAGRMVAPWRGDAAKIGVEVATSFDSGMTTGGSNHYTILLSDGGAVFMPGVTPLRGQLMLGMIGGVKAVAERTEVPMKGCVYWYWDAEENYAYT